MTDGIGKGIASQLGNLAGDIATEVAYTPAKIAGFDVGSGEKKGVGIGGKAHGQIPQQTRQPQEQIDIEHLRQKDEGERQKGLSQARDLIRQFNRPQQEQPDSLEHQRKVEELQKEQDEIERMKADAKILRFGSSKSKRGNLFGKKVKQQKTFGSEQSKNAIHQ